MPGHFIHMSSMKHAATSLANSEASYSPAPSPGDNPRINPDWGGQDPTEAGKLMLQYSNFANLGAIGPDLFFFLPDFRDYKGFRTSSVLVTVLNFLEGLYSAVDRYVTKYEQYLGPISEDQAEEMSRVTGGLSEIVGDITGDLSSIFVTFYVNLATELCGGSGFLDSGIS
jgi:hypothetical protein